MAKEEKGFFERRYTSIIMYVYSLSIRQT